MKEKKWIALCVVALLVLAMMNLSDATTARVKGAVRDGVSPLQGVLSGGMRQVREIFRYIRGVKDLAEENRRLTEHLAVLRGEVERLREAEADNLKLRALMDFTEKSPQRLVSCEVTGRDSTGWWQTVRLDKGRRGGVAGGRAVITPDGLVGRTTDAGERTADVLLLTDPACKVSVRLATEPVFGILSGCGGGPRAGQCRMDYVPARDEVPEGAEVVTSGYGDVFPRGLRVGVVLETEKSADGLYQTAWIEPFAEFPQLEYAFVIATEDDLAAADAEALELEMLEDAPWEDGEADVGAEEGDLP